MIAWEAVDAALQRVRALTGDLEALVRDLRDVERLQNEGLGEEARRKAAYLEARLAKCRQDLDATVGKLVGAARPRPESTPS